MHLLEWVGVGSPPCEEEGETNSLEYAGNGTNGNGIKRTLLGKDLGDERWGRAGEEDQRSQIGGSLVGESTGSIDQSTNTV